MQEVGGKMLLHFPHSPRPCGLATSGTVAEKVGMRGLKSLTSLTLALTQWERGFLEIPTTK